ncbi:MAG: ribose-phosphate diphosphokinase [Patescibacteria group bacterium]
MSIQIYCQKYYRALGRFLAKKIPFAQAINHQFRRYPNLEAHIKIPTSARHHTCLIIGTIAPPDSNYLEIILLAHTLKKEKAKEIILILPYFAYTRHDKDKTGESIATKLIITSLQNAGVDQILTLDLHSHRTKEFSKIPLESISTASLFAHVIKNNKLTKAELISPDQGAMDRLTAIKKLLKITSPHIYFQKSRTNHKVTCVLKSPVKTKKAIIVDDQLDTGGTLICACRELQKQGVKEIYIMITHGLFTGHNWKKLFKLGVKKIYTTDTIPNLPPHPQIQILPINPLLLSTINKL